MYLNRVYFGSGSYGVEAASRRYFGKSARDVTLAEAALLAGLLKAPSKLSPARDPKAAEDRAQLVLAAMRGEGMIGQKELATAMSAAADARRLLLDRLGKLCRRPHHGRASRPDRRDARRHHRRHHGRPRPAEARRKIDPPADRRERQEAQCQPGRAGVDRFDSGAVRAMVGGYDYADSQFDRASEARRQPGSAFKPFVYLAALEQGRTPDSVRNDAPIKIGSWTPDNYHGKYYGRVTLATALAKSLNSVAAQLAMEVGPDNVVETAHRMGIESDLQANTSIALGTSEVTPLELTAAYVPFANGGYRPDVHFIQRITTASGDVLYESKHNSLPRVVRPEIVGMMNAMMRGTVEDGTATKAAFAWPAAGKTGTSQNSRDAWFIGYTANLTTGVWFGNDDGTPMKKVTGGALPALAWHEFMVAAHEGVPVAQLPGGWSGASAGVVAPQPLVDIGPASEPAPKPVRAIVPAERAQPVARSAPVEDKTASIRRPLADVGDRKRTKRETSILDVILGNGQ